MGKKVFITITGTNHYLGDEFLNKGTRVTLIKDPDNKYDHEAIRVEMEGLGKIGYVANSTYTVLGECFSAGRLYDKIGDRAVAKVKYVLPKGVICSVREKDLRWPQLSLSEGSDQGCLLIPATSKVPEYDQKKNTEEGDDLV
jgi:hypothetical protein